MVLKCAVCSCSAINVSKPYPAILYGDATFLRSNQIK
jgi:hypothetical protein